jgi:hypothetical protein
LTFPKAQVHSTSTKPLAFLSLCLPGSGLGFPVLALRSPYQQKQAWQISLSLPCHHLETVLAPLISTNVTAFLD